MVFEDSTFRVLIILNIVSTIVEIINSGWIKGLNEGVSLFIVIGLIAFISSYNNFRRDS